MIAEKLDGLMLYLQEQAMFNGSILLRDKDTIYIRHNGVSEQSTGVKTNDLTTYDLCSVSKPFTALAILMLREQGRLSLEDGLDSFVPELSFYSGIRIMQLLNHTSGIPDYTQLFHEHWNPLEVACNTDFLDFLVQFRPKPLFEPGSRWEYSNTGYVLLSIIVERATGITFGEFLKNHVFEKVGLKHTRLPESVGDNQTLYDAVGYIRGEDGSFIRSDQLPETRYAFIWAVFVEMDPSALLLRICAGLT
ncbi:serine hydrolase domain-containing protein [Paenibacillus chartarius]|uniref:Serine hydrolase domain-containing protein n=1 Tax=Paenibacillus chartarius TaxID=747481 RepID=A0ABV6DMZ9_9BACL